LYGHICLLATWATPLVLPQLYTSYSVLIITFTNEFGYASNGAGLMYLDGVFEMFEWLKKKTAKKKRIKDVPDAKIWPNPPIQEPDKTAKRLATERGEPWVQVLSINVDANNLHQGSFELDWNEIFVARLIKAGYMIKKDDTDAEIVDRWFQNVCRHVVMETWEQEEAIKKSGIYVQSRDIGGGRSEIS
jgi:hypothetical protein